MRQPREWRDRALIRSKDMLASAMTVVASLAEEIAVGAGVVLITVALWQDFGLRSLAIPGALLVWIALPQRTRFIEAAPRAADPKGKQ